MKYFKKIGIRTEEEQAMLQAIEAVILSKGIPRTEIPDCLNLDDLIEVKHLVDAYSMSEEPSFDELVRTEEFDNVEGNTEEFNEQEEDLFNTVAELPDLKSEEAELELDEIFDNEPSEFVANDYDPFEAPIIERSYNKKDSNVQSMGEDGIQADGEHLELEEARDTPLDDLNPRTKQRAAEQTANTILKGYARLVPKPFKWLAKVDEAKVEKLAFSGQLDVSIEVSEGLTFEDYMTSTNEQIDEIFEVDEDTLDEIREPLIEVLMEQQLELTPQQRLSMAVLSHLVQMFTVAMKLRNQNNRILSFQKELTRLSRTNVA